MLTLLIHEHRIFFHLFISSISFIKVCSFQHTHILTSWLNLFCFFFDAIVNKIIFFILKIFCSVQSYSCVRLFVTPLTAARQTSLSMESVMPSNHLILCHPLLLLPSIFPRIRVFSNESVLHIRWQKYWSVSFSISHSNECSGLISFKIDWYDLLAVQGTRKSLLQHHSSKASIHQCSTFLIIQFSHPYMTTGKAIALTRWTFVGKVMPCFLICCRLVITFLPRSKHLLISWLQSSSTLIL